MKIFFESSFEKDLKQVKDKQLLRRISQVIEDIKVANGPNDIKQLEKLKGYENFYRIRISDYRMGIVIVEDKIFIIRILQRKEIYRFFP